MGLMEAEAAQQLCSALEGSVPESAGSPWTPALQLRRGNSEAENSGKRYLIPVHQKPGTLQNRRPVAGPLYH